MRDCSIKFLNSLVTDNTTKKELEIIKFIKKCVNECCEKKQDVCDTIKRENIFKFWNEQNIIKHKVMSKETEKAIDKSLKKYSEKEIKTYIERYKRVISDKTYFFDYKWTLSDFLSRKDGISAFTDEGSKWVSYKNKKKVVDANDTFSSRDCTAEELNSLFDNLDEMEV